MVNYCNVYGCTNRSDRESDRSFFRIPAVIRNQGTDCEKLSIERRRIWLSNLNQDFTGKNLANVRVCSDHFVSKKPATLYNRMNPDWAPNVAMGHEKLKSPNVVQERHARVMERKVKKDLNDAAHSLILLQKTALPTLEENDEQHSLQSHTESQTEVNGELFESMTSELQVLRLENGCLKKQAAMVDMTLGSLEGKDGKVKYLTGLSSFCVLATLFAYIEPFLPPKRSMNSFQMLVMTLMRLRLNLPEQFIAYEFGVSQATICRVFTDTIEVLYARMKCFVHWPDREQLQKTMPMEFRKYFGNKVAVIIDCFEIFIERPSNLMARAETWSSYKHHNTVKFMMGITPQGTVSFISKAWGGRVTDKYVTEHSGFLNHILPGDIILADRGFDIQDLVGSQCAEAKIPAFTRGKDQLSPLELESTRKIAHCRIHVERVIGCVRQKYTILGGTLPIDYMLTKDENNMTLIDKICNVCCSLTNLCEPIVSFD